MRGRDADDAIAAEIAEEIAGHLELRAHDLAREGLEPSAARAEALRRFGDPDAVGRECRDLARRMRAEQRGAELRSGILADLGLAARLLARGRCFARPALATVAIAVAASVVVLQAARASIPAAPPYRHAERVVMLWNRYAADASDLFAVSPPEAAELRAEVGAFEAVATVRPDPTSLVVDGAGSERVLAYHVSPDLFDLLGAAPTLGRALRASAAGGGEREVVLSHALWERRFASDPRAIGRRVRVGGEWHRVAGVMPPGARFPDGIGALPGAADLWVAHAPAQLASRPRSDQVLGVVALLRAGRSLADARADLDAYERRRRDAHPARYAPPAVPVWGVSAIPLVDHLRADARPTLLLLGGAVGVVLLMAGLTTVHLMLARGDARRDELATRIALGASPTRLVRQLVAEGVVLAMCGGAAGVVVGSIALGLLARLAPGAAASGVAATPDGPALLAAGVVATAVGAIVSLLPAAGLASRGTPRGTPHGARADGLLVAQLAAALVLALAAGLLVRSVGELQDAPLGMSVRDVVALDVARAGGPARGEGSLAELLGAAGVRVAREPGVEGVGAVYPLPLSTLRWSGTFHIADDRTRRPGDPLPHAEYAVVTPGYFGAMGVPLLAGRDFGAADSARGALAVIVDETLARRWWPGGSALGMRIDPNGRPGTWATVVGVVGHVRSRGPETGSEPQLYLPFAQRPQPMMSLVVRSRGADAAAWLGPVVRDTLGAHDATVPVGAARPLGATLDDELAPMRFNAAVLVLFAAVGLWLAGAALHALMSRRVSLGRRELALRIVLGSDPSALRARVVREGLRLAAAGVLFGLALSSVLPLVVGREVLRLGAPDAVAYAVVALVLVLVALVAVREPAGRAARAGAPGSSRD